MIGSEIKREEPLPPDETTPAVMGKNYGPRVIKRARELMALHGYTLTKALKIAIAEILP